MMRREFHDYQYGVRLELQKMVRELPEDTLRSRSMEDIVTEIVNHAMLSRLELDGDPNLERQSIKGTNQERIIIRCPIVPGPDVELVLSLRPLPMNDGPFDFDYHDGYIIFGCGVDEKEITNRLGQLKNDIIASRNRKVDEFNNGLRPVVEPLVAERKKQVEAADAKFKATMESLPFKIAVRGEEKSRIVDLARKRRAPVPATSVPAPAPTGGPATKPKKDWSLRPQDLTEFLEVIGHACHQFEINPGTFLQLGEEDLRNYILGNLNAAFKGGATGETFNKHGKTDIRLEADGGGLFVSECKFWDGVELYRKTIGQLFGYLTWRETYGTMVTFVKTKDMSDVIGKVFELLKNDGRPPQKVTETHLVSTHKHPEDAGRTVTVHHLFFHLAAK